MRTFHIGGAASGTSAEDNIETIFQVRLSITLELLRKKMELSSP
jgi:flagellar motor switch/type III secretory pathway protein FliN